MSQKTPNEIVFYCIVFYNMAGQHRIIFISYLYHLVPKEVKRIIGAIFSMIGHRKSWQYRTLSFLKFLLLLLSSFVIASCYLILLLFFLLFLFAQLFFCYLLLLLLLVILFCYCFFYCFSLSSYSFVIFFCYLLLLSSFVIFFCYCFFIVSLCPVILLLSSFVNFFCYLLLLSSFVIFFCYCFFIVSLCPVILFISLVLKVVKEKLFHDCQWSGSTSTIKLVINSLIFVNVLIKSIYPVTVNLTSVSYNAVMSLSSEIRNSFFITTICIILLLVSGSVEKHPGPIKESRPYKVPKTSLSFAMWNLDSIPARNYCRISLIESFQAVYDFDIFGACESSLTVLIPNGEIFIHGFSLEPFISYVLQKLDALF